MDCIVSLLLLINFLTVGCIPPTESSEEELRARLTPGLAALLNTSTFLPCTSTTGSRGVTCQGFTLGDGCLRHFLWCRKDFTVSCGDHGLVSNNELFCGNKR